MVTSVHSLEKNMKKLVCLLAVISLAAPLFAANVVNVTLTPSGQNVTVSYAMDGGSTFTPVAIGLKADITAGVGCISGSSSYTANFIVYPDYIYSHAGTAFTGGHPIAKPAVAGELVLPPTVTSASICMAKIVLATPGPNPGPASDTLLVLSLQGVGSVDLTVSADTGRGGVVGSGAVTTNLPQTVSVNCVPQCWTAMCDGQANGDADCDTECNFNDYDALYNAFFTDLGVNTLGTAYGDHNPCADFDRDGSINFNDYDVLSINFFTTPGTTPGTPVLPCGAI